MAVKYLDLLPRVIFVRVDTELLADLHEWTEPLHVKVEARMDGTYDLVFREPDELEQR